jgi:hypothetical protein
MILQRIPPILATSARPRYSLFRSCTFTGLRRVSTKLGADTVGTIRRPSYPNSHAFTLASETNTTL